MAVLVGVLPIPGLEVYAQRTAAIAVWMAVWWMTEAIPIPATALFPLVAFPAAGIMSSAETAAPYANHLIFLFLGGFFMAKAIESWGLHRRISLHVLLRMGAEPRRLVLGVMVSTAFLSMWISNTATAVMMLPIGTALVNGFRKPASNFPVPLAADERNPASDPNRDRAMREVNEFATALMLGIAYAATIGGVGTLIGTPPNLVFATMVNDLLGKEIGFVEWMGVGLPIVFILLPLCWLFLTRWAHPLPDRLRVEAENTPRRDLEEMGPMSPGERTVMWIFVAMVCAWLFREEKHLGAWVIPGIETWFPQISDATIAMAGAMGAFSIPLSLQKKEFVLGWKTALSIPWGVLLLFGGGLSLANGFQATGLSTWIGELVGGLKGLPTGFVLIIACALILGLTELTSNTATATMAMPIFAAAAIGLGFHPYLLMAPAAIAASLAFMLPVATPPNAIVFGSGSVTMGQMMRAGLILNLVSLVMAGLAGLYLVPWVLTM